MIFLRYNDALTRLKKELNEEIVNGTAIIQNLSSIITSRINIILNEDNFKEGIVFLLENWINELDIVLNEEDFLKENVMIETIQNLYFVGNLIKYINVENLSAKIILEKAQNLEIVKLEKYKTLPVKIKIYDYLLSLDIKNDNDKIETLLSLFCKNPHKFNLEKNIETKNLFILDLLNEIYSKNKGFDLVKELLDNLITIMENTIEDNKDEDYHKVEVFYNDEIKNISYINSEIFVPNSLFSIKYGNCDFINHILKKTNDVNLRIIENIVDNCPDKIIFFEFNELTDKDGFSKFVEIINKKEKILSVLKISFINFKEIFSWDFILKNGHGLYFEHMKIQEDYLLNIPYTNKNDVEKIVKNLFLMETNIYNVETKKTGEKIKNKIFNFCYNKIPYIKKIMTNVMIEKVNEMVDLRNENIFKFNYDKNDLENKLVLIEEFYKNKNKISNAFLKKEKKSSEYMLSLHPDNLLIFFLTNLDIELSSKIKIVHDFASKLYVNEDVFWIFYLMKLVNQDTKIIEKEMYLNTSKDYNMLKTSLSIIHKVINYDSNSRYVVSKREKYSLIQNLLNSRGEKAFIKESLVQDLDKEELIKDEPVEIIKEIPKKRRL